jgi:hypothetical protein
MLTLSPSFLDIARKGLKTLIILSTLMALRLLPAEYETNVMKTIKRSKQLVELRR